MNKILDQAVDLGLAAQIDGNSLPSFASDSNKKLDSEINDKQARMDVVDQQVVEVEQRIKVMSEHLINVRNELQLTQEIITARKEELNTENHMSHLERRKIERFISDIKKTSIEIEKYRERFAVAQKDVFRGNEKISDFQKKMNWNEEELENWKMHERQRDEDMLAIDKYKKVDDSRIRDMSLSIEKLALECNRKKQETADEVTNTQSSQVELDNAVAEFRRLHQYRQQIISQWEEAVHNLQERDKTVQVQGDKYAQLLAANNNQETKLKRAVAFLDQEDANNKRLEINMNNAERDLAKAREDDTKATQSLLEFENETEALRNRVGAAGSILSKLKNQVANIGQNVLDEEKRVESIKKRIDATNQKIENEMRAVTSKGQSSQEIEAFLAELRGQLNDLTKELKHKEETLFKKRQNLMQLKKQEASRLADITAFQSGLKSLQAQCRKLLAEIRQQRTLSYDVEFQAQLMQRKVARASGERTSQELDYLLSKIKSLEDELITSSSTSEMLTKQIKRLTNQSRLTVTEKEKAEVAHEAINENLKCIETQIESINLSVTQTMKQKEEELISHDLLKLEVNKTKERLRDVNETVGNIEDRTADARMAAKEAVKESEMQQEILQTELRCLEDERHKIMMQLQDRRIKINLLKTKYQSLVAKLGLEEDGPECRSQAYYVIKHAQQKEEISRQGDELDSKIQTAQMEMKALENTKNQLLGTNSAMRAQGGESEEQREKDMLEKQLREAENDKTRDLLLLESVKTDLDDHKRKLTEMQTHENQLMSIYQKSSGGARSLDNDILQQQGKIDRAMKNAQQKKKIAGSKVTENVVKSLNVTAVKIGVNALLSSLNNVFNGHPDVAQIIIQTLKDQGIAASSAKLLSPRSSESSSRRSSEASSHRSSARSVGSGLKQVGSSRLSRAGSAISYNSNCSLGSIKTFELTLTNSKK
eukprot:GHVL01032253.1.p1 GENE.GHVL01032253.1~~GHVL01032253.1.p1  ORF type:complete len:940 (-),score=187.98 GHVL01032253.1:4497-7316(-)